MTAKTREDGAARVGSLLAELEEVMDRQLTKDQRAILRLLVLGLSANVIAAVLDLPDRTVRAHLQSLSVGFHATSDLGQDSWNVMWAEPTPTLMVFEAYTRAYASHGEGFNSLQLDEAAEIGEQSGIRAAAATAWRHRVGETLDTEAVTKLLGVTRQALDSRKRSGSVLALPAAGTSHYPRWQFRLDDTGASVRGATSRIVNSFKAAINDVSPYLIASWAMSPQPELDGKSPADWLLADGDDEPVVIAARRAAHIEAQ